MHFIIKDLHICCDGHEIEELVADSDGYYHASFEFDEAWNDLAKTARFICENEYSDSLIGPDNTCLVPGELVRCPGVLRVGVYAGQFGKSLQTYNSVCVRLTQSIITDSSYTLPDDPNPAIYTQIASAAADALKIARSVEERADNGEFNGRDGKDGTGSSTGDGGMENFADVTIEKQGDKIKKVLLDVIRNTKADDNTSLVFEIIHKLFEGGPLSKLALTYEYARLISDYCSELNGGSAKVQVGDIERIGNYKFFGTDENGNYYNIVSKITAEILGVSGLDGISPIRIINVADPIKNLDVANKRYVDNEIATFDFIKVVDTLPEEGLPNKIYLVPKPDSQTNDLFDEYIWVNDAWEFVTTKQVEMDLTSYAKTSYVDNLVAQKSQVQIVTWEDDD